MRPNEYMAIRAVGDIYAKQWQRESYAVVGSQSTRSRFGELEGRDGEGASHPGQEHADERLDGARLIGSCDYHIADAVLWLGLAEDALTSELLNGREEENAQARPRKGHTAEEQESVTPGKARRKTQMSQTPLISCAQIRKGWGVRVAVTQRKSFNRRALGRMPALPRI